MMNSSSGTTNPSQHASPGQPRSQTPLGWAWISVALVPVFFAVAFALQYGIYALTGNEPGQGTAPFSVDLAAGLAALVILLVPCLAGVFHGLRAMRSGARAAWVPTVLSGLLAVGATVLVVLNL